MIQNKYELEIVFFKNNRFYNKLIQAFTQCEFDHVGVITKREGGIIQVHEALNNGLVATQYNIEEFNLMNIKIKKLCVGMHPLQVEKRANAYLGKPYGWIDIFLITLYRYLKPFKLHKPIYWFTNGNKLICSEFVARLVYDASYKEINFAQEYNTKYSLVTPAMIYNSMYFLIKREKQKKLLRVDY